MTVMISYDECSEESCTHFVLSTHNRKKVLLARLREVGGTRSVQLKRPSIFLLLLTKPFFKNRYFPSTTRSSVDSSLHTSPQVPLAVAFKKRLPFRTRYSVDFQTFEFQQLRSFFSPPIPPHFHLSSTNVLLSFKQVQQSFSNYRTDNSTFSA